MVETAEDQVEASSGNVFADLGLPNAEELSTKVKLSVAINNILEDRKLNQVDAAKLLGINQPKVSALRGYKLDGFSVGRLMHFLGLLGYDVTIEIKPKVGAMAMESVTMQAA